MPRFLLRALVALAALLPMPALADPAPARRLVLIDDDFIGLNGVGVLLLQSPDVEILGITTTSGSVWRDTATAYALRTLEILHRTDIPVVPGATYPLLNSQEATKRWEGMYGRLVFKGPWTDYWPGDTVQKHPGAPAPDDVPPLSTGNPTTKPSSRTRRRLPRPHRPRPSARDHPVRRHRPDDQHRHRPEPRSRLRRQCEGAGLYGRQPQPAAAARYRFGAAIRPRICQHAAPRVNIRWDPEAARIVAHAPFPKVTMIPVDP